MVRVSLTEARVQEILAAEKLVSEDVTWAPKASGTWVACEINVKNNLKLILNLYANANLLDRDNFSFSLILSKSYRIASFDAGGSHSNRHTNLGKWLTQPHKHRWTEICRDSFAYTPTDVDITSIETAFRSFCNEVNIKFSGQVAPVPAIQAEVLF